MNKSIKEIIKEIDNEIDLAKNINILEKNYMIYIVHYYKLFERKNNLIEQFKANNINSEQYEFLIEYKRDNIIEKDMSMFDLNKVSIGSVAITLSHILAYIKLIQSKKDFCLVFEDDVIFDNNFKNNLDNYINQLPDDWEMLFIGDGCNLHIDSNIINNSDKNIFLKSHYEPIIYGNAGATRCVDSYLINRKCASKILKEIINLNSKIDLNIDLWLNIILRKLDIKVYWAEPTIVTQGTQNGKYNTSH